MCEREGGMCFLCQKPFPMFKCDFYIYLQSQLSLKQENNRCTKAFSLMFRNKDNLSVSIKPSVSSPLPHHHTPPFNILPKALHIDCIIRLNTPFQLTKNFKHISRNVNEAIHLKFEIFINNSSIPI